MRLHRILRTGEPGRLVGRHFGDVVIDDHDVLLAYCRQQLLPIWERWTDGNASMRLALQCEGSGPGHHRESLNGLTDAAFLLFRRASRPQSAAPLYAAIAVIYALQDYPLHVVIDAGLQAITMNATAEEELESSRIWSQGG